MVSPKRPHCADQRPAAARKSDHHPSARACQKLLSRLLMRHRQDPGHETQHKSCTLALCIDEAREKSVKESQGGIVEGSMRCTALLRCKDYLKAAWPPRPRITTHLHNSSQTKHAQAIILCERMTRTHLLSGLKAASKWPLCPLVLNPKLAVCERVTRTHLHSGH